MSLAVVFDSAGTLMHTLRMAKDVIHGELITDVETTMLTFADPDRVLCVIESHARDIMATSPEELLSRFMADHAVQIGISCTRRVVRADEIFQTILADTKATTGDMQECMRIIWSKIREEPIVTLNNGVIVNLSLQGIEFTVTAGGTPFPGARDTIRELHEMGVGTFIASGDREAKLEKMADYLGIPRDRVFGVATPSIKEQIVRDLREQYNQVIMVGDSINDLRAMRTADIAVLTDQQCDRKPSELIKAADYRIRDVREVPGIVRQVDLNRA